MTTSAMKVKLTILVLMVIGLIVTGCSKDDNDHTPNMNVVSAFNARYPDARQVKWDTKAGYHIADFINGSSNAEAWYDDSGNWIATETELSLKTLPIAVQNSFGFSQYANWNIDDVSMLERDLAPEPVYIIEAEKGDVEVKLHYAKEGTLINIQYDDNNSGFQPVTIPQAIRNYINTNYSGAVILDYEKEKTGFEIDIYYSGMYIELQFDLTDNWVSSSFDTTLHLLPQAVQDAFAASQYASYEIDAIKQVQKPAGTFYEFELEQANGVDLIITFNAQGEIV